ncbi:putative ABC transport system ATP-binding protein [Ruminiclostridium sufflavum DSM 19573]|uniref:Putative ABC transport system ATP-binding protein n=1 Tax=Ruminiclostridium sufflavum DSM 19573 TaxID=1121337 RepID=A0A318XM04_9FIRM|nr:ABC transporter ATP-binding protein [Ruminiclostridium sufflavum]PYG87472.1 putative ABC transport system ATP-binding protein [Ruminiclostridium sufflavum DSM 19573]
MYLEIRNLKKYYGEGESRTEVLKGISCSIGKGQICVLLGPSGSGKSTLLNMIGGIEKIDEGEIIVDGKPLANLEKRELSRYRRNELGFVFQFYNLVPNLTVKENIEVCEYLSKSPLPIDELIKTLGLWEHKDKFPNQLSGGQQQRCAIGRALVKNPGILLCDEPTGALDYKTSKEILELIETVNKKFNTTIIIVTHNDAIKNMAHKVMKLHDGMIKKEYINESLVSAGDLEW